MNFNNIIPIFYDTSSRKSILTLEAPKDVKENGPQSIIKLCKDNRIDMIINVSTNFHNFVNGYKECKKENIQYIFGLELWVCDDPTLKEEAEKNESKIVVMIKNEAGYKDLIKLYSATFTNKSNKYFKFRASWKILKEMWSDNLLLCIPFFDSFLHRNKLTFAKIMPEFPTAPENIWFWREVNSGLPFEPLINDAIDNFNADKQYNEIQTKTIYYQDSADLIVKAFIIYKSIMQRSNFFKPEFDHFCSKNFSFGNYLEVIK